MKKYVKPELFYEHYELNQHIADCAWEFKNSKDEYSCTAEADPKWDHAGYEMFNSGSCNVEPGSFENFCYHNGGSGGNTFAS